MASFYLWKPGTLERVARVDVDGAGIRLHDSEDPELADILAELGGYPALPLRTQALQNGQFITTETKVAPGDEGYPFAVGQLASQVSGFEVSYTPNRF